MIPSRPLDLGGILSESIRIIRLTFLRMGMITLLALLPGWIALYWGVSEATSDVNTYLTEHHFTNPESEIIIRDYFLDVAKNDNNFSIYRIIYAEKFKLIDSAYERSTKDLPADKRSVIIRARVDSLFGVSNSIHEATQDTDSQSSPFLDLMLQMFYRLSPALILLVLGAIFQMAAMYDLASRGFEERALSISRVLRLALARNMWLLMAQIILISLAMLAGLGVLIGIGFAISEFLGVFVMLAALSIMFFALIRLSFSQIALVSENLGPIKSTTRSFELTGHNFIRIVGIFFIGILLIIVVSAVIRIPFDFIFAVNFDTAIKPYIVGADPHISQILALIKNIFVNIFFESAIVSFLTASLLPVFVTTFYYDLRTRLDGPLDYNEKPPEMTTPEPATISE